ncbi:TIGR03118 family protein [Chitinophaga agrisoli]|uniref:TIGR03118 family protein n=1 Tax=Chitinophaga agrisoli TaxID=2607653 RepID=A0A5B2VZ40_9BACT|nr:TIGR03118 family protein [Chitinophaga agrisoli]KAA2243592.1 TIGR03118 family protein [Chitinophaga agrisoli]
MKPTLFNDPPLLKAGVMGLCLLLGTGCKKIEQHFLPNDYEQVNLVADVAGFGAARLDSNLVNAWGIAVAPSGPLWISAAETGVSTIYDRNGADVRPPVKIPTPTDSTGGSPTGQVFNNTTDFAIWQDKTATPSRFIFATEEGTLAAWGGGNTATLVADRSPWHAVYKGLALAQDGGKNYLYATDFRGAKIDVFDKDFKYVTGKPFHDPGIPAGYAPFNIRNIGGYLYVTYAKQQLPEKEDDEPGMGNGYVDVYRPNGAFVKRFATRGALNSPWGMAVAAPGFCPVKDVILIGNFGDGHINMYSLQGIFLGPLKSGWRTISIPGLWALENNVPMADPKQLFFTAGPDGERHGLFGYLINRH